MSVGLIVPLPASWWCSAAPQRAARRRGALISPGPPVSLSPSTAVSRPWVQVDKRAVARQTAQEMAARLDREAIAVQPTLVIWETGTTDAVDGTDLDACRQTLQAGLERLRASEVEVVCMAIQFARQTDAVINFDRYESVLREVTDANEGPLFHRHDLMHHGAESGVFDLGRGDHDELRCVASRLYDCIGRAVADCVARGVHPAVSAPPVRSGSHP